MIDLPGTTANGLRAAVAWPNAGSTYAAQIDLAKGEARTRFLSSTPQRDPGHRRHDGPGGSR